MEKEVRVRVASMSLSSIALQAVTDTNVVGRRESSKKSTRRNEQKRKRGETRTEKREKESENKNNKPLLPSLCV